MQLIVETDASLHLWLQYHVASRRWTSLTASFNELGQESQFLYFCVEI